MKRIFYLFLFLISFNCSSPYPSERNIIRIEMRGVQSEYVLLAVRDSSLIVVEKPPEKTYIPREHITDSARSIRFDQIDKIIYHHAQDGNGILTSGLTGCGLGMGAGCAAAGYSKKGNELSTVFVGGLVGSVAGCAAAIAISTALSTYDEQLFLDTKLHLDKVRDHAIFSGGEPAELQRIK